MSAKNDPPAKKKNLEWPRRFSGLTMIRHCTSKILMEYAKKSITASLLKRE
jgi:hypothetical protein